MAYEPSEILTAAALTYSNNELDEASKSYDSLVKLMVDIKKKVNKTSFNMLQYGNQTIQNGFTDLIDEKDSKRRNKRPKITKI